MKHYFDFHPNSPDYDAPEYYDDEEDQYERWYVENECKEEVME